MKMLKKFLHEGTEGLFLLLIAVLIFTGFPGGFQRAESKSEKGSIAENQTVSEEKKVEEVVSEVVENNAPMADDSKEVNSDQVKRTTSSQETAKVIVPDSNVDKYDNIKNYLKKYCDKSGSDNRKKCKQYCAEAKSASKKEHKYDKLREKYCENKKEEDDNNSVSSSSAVSQSNELNFIVGSKEFKIAIEEGESVFSLMKRAKSQGKIDFKYDDFGGDLGVMITEINGVKNGNDADWTQNKYWILYVSGKSSSVGCSGHKLNKNDTSVEWKYEKYSY